MIQLSDKGDGVVRAYEPAVETVDTVGRFSLDANVLDLEVGGTDVSAPCASPTICFGAPLYRRDGVVLKCVDILNDFCVVCEFSHSRDGDEGTNRELEPFQLSTLTKNGLD
jgi:hypothetical protein